VAVQRFPRVFAHVRFILLHQKKDQWQNDRQFYNAGKMAKDAPDFISAFFISRRDGWRIDQRRLFHDGIVVEKENGVIKKIGFSEKCGVTM